MKPIITVVFLLHTLLFIANSPKREMRGIWIATVTNVDFPSKNVLSTEEQKKEIISLLDTHQKQGINTVFFQVRTSCDALYYSEIEPWSLYLTGKQGKAPHPIYDPLTYIIEEAHKRNMELHAWINPFRASPNNNVKLGKGHPYVKHPEWGWKYGTKTYLDPGIPEVRKYVQNVVLDIVKRYDIDGIHFDDYFYPYNISGKKIPDSKSFTKYGGEFYPYNIEDWRRDNVNTFIKDIYSAIKEQKKWVKFGVSPFGIWKNSASTEDKLPTKWGVTSYGTLYADVVKWMQEGWMDYCAPQIYWHIGQENTDYIKLQEWWSKQSNGRHMYVGHSLFKVNESAKEIPWKDYKEIERQIELTRKNENIDGSIMYSSHHLIDRKELYPLSHLLKHKLYKHYAMPPQMPWIDNKNPSSPRSISSYTNMYGNHISWKAPKYKDEMNKASKYIIYRLNTGRGEKGLVPENIIAITSEVKYTLPCKYKEGIYGITSIDRMNNESKPVYIHIKKSGEKSIVFENNSERRSVHNDIIYDLPDF